MDYVLSLKPASRGCHRMTRLNRSAFGANTTALLPDVRAARALDRTEYATAGKQLRVGGIHDRLCRSLRDVTAHQAHFLGISDTQHHRVILIVWEIHLTGQVHFLSVSASRRWRMRCDPPCGR